MEYWNNKSSTSTYALPSLPESKLKFTELRSLSDSIPKLESGKALVRYSWPEDHQPITKQDLIAEDWIIVNLKTK